LDHFASSEGIGRDSRTKVDYNRQFTGVDHYRRLANRLAEASKNRFLDQLEALQREVQSLLSAGAG
jgi:hypothetical protein